MDRISGVSFGSIYTSKPLKELTKKDTVLKKQTDSIKRLLWQNGLHKTKYTDIQLNYGKYDGFYATISSKKQGIPMNPGYRSPQIKKDNLTPFIEWQQEWEQAYNPKNLKAFKNLEEKALKIMKKLSK